MMLILSIEILQCLIKTLYNFQEITQQMGVKGLWW